MSWKLLRDCEGDKEHQTLSLKSNKDEVLVLNNNIEFKVRFNSIIKIDVSIEYIKNICKFHFIERSDVKLSSKGMRYDSCNT